MNTMKKLALVTMALTLLLAATALPVFAAAGKAPLYNDTAGTGFTCAAGVTDTTGPVYGFAVMNTTGKHKLTIEISLKRATPNATYDIWVNQDPGTCPLSAATALGALVTNGKGNGNAHVTLTAVGGATNFWVSAVGGGQTLRSVAVTLR